uniref:Cytochrome P450 71B12 n=1 Tax=Isatis tinctoria TaxID=161756 RepID=A0A8F0FRF5_ISATI|nr:cytochrome P450 71B12 [Isatis tinctoria]
MSLWYIIVGFVFFACILIAKNTRKTEKEKKNLPPGPPKLPMIGNLHQLGSQPHRSMFKLSKKYGSLMSLKFGSVDTVVASTPETVKDVLKTFDVDCCSRPYLTYPARITYNLNDLVFSPYNKYWREVRKMTVVELYTAKRVQSFRHVREEEVASFVDFIKQSASLENPVNFSQKLMKLSGSVICRIGFGINLKGSKLENTYDQVIAQTFQVLGSFAAADYFPVIGKIIDRITGLHSKCEKVFEAIDSFFDQAIKHHLDDESVQDDIIASLLKMERGETGLGEYQLTRNHTKGILLNILAAGIDTSAQTVTWVMTHLIANPRVLKKAQAEVREVIRNKDHITEEDIDRLEYLQMVIKETFRISPIVPLLVPREASKDVKIGGYDIPKKTWIHVNIWAVHMNPSVWKDPEAFIPERFMDKEIDYKGLNFELLPFGSGRRVCPGMGMGMALVHLALINLLYRFDWKLPEGMKVDIEESYGLVCSKKVPLQLIPVLTQWT